MPVDAMRRAPLPLSAIALLAAACGSSVTAVRADAATDALATDALAADALTADALTADVPAMPSQCRWSMSDRYVVVSDPADQQRFRLLDAVPTPDGALVAWRERSPTGRDDQVRVRRVLDDGTAHPWSAPGRGSRAEVVSLPSDAALQFSMVWDAPRDGAAMLAGGQTDRGGCALVQFRGDDSQTSQGVDLSATMGFPLHGCGSLARTTGGWSFLTAEVRALWGDALVFLTDDGRLAGEPTRLPMTGNSYVGPMTRTAVSDGFVETWVEPVRGTEGPLHELHLRRFDARGAPRGGDEDLGTADLISDAQVLETPAGLLAVWHHADRALQGYNGILTRPLLPDASPTAGLMRYLDAPSAAGIHAAVRGSQVLLAAPTAMARGARIHLLILDGRGVPLRPALELVPGPMPVGVGPVRVIPTRRGALVVFEVESGAQGGRVLAVPVDCLP